MLIHQTDFLTVNLLRNHWKWVSWNQNNGLLTEWELCWLVFTIQVNGKLKTSTISFAIKDITPTDCEPKIYEVDNRTTITTAIDLFHDLWYDISINDIEEKINKIINDN